MAAGEESWQQSWRRREHVELRFQRLATRVGVLDQSGLIHPEREFAGLTVVSWFRARHVTLAVFAERDAKVKAAQFWIDGVAAQHSSLNQRRKICVHSAVLLGIDSFPGGQTLQQIFDVRSEERRVGKECRSRW